MSTKSKKRKPVEGEETEEELRAIRKKNSREDWLRRTGTIKPDRDERMEAFFACHPEVRSFFEEHGDFASDENGRHFIFEDGAQLRKTSSSSFGNPIEPPEDARKRADLIAKFCATKYKQARKVAREYQQALISETGVFLETTYEEKEEKLQKLQDDARKWRKKLEAAVKEYNDLEPAWESRKRKDDAEAKQAKADHQTRVRSMKI